MNVLFVSSPGLFAFTKRDSHKRGRSICHANINQTKSQDREDEIAAKIASFRKMKRLRSQKVPASESTTNESEVSSENAGAIQSFKDLPDWKKEEVLQGHIAEAEAFLNPNSSNRAPSPPLSTDEKYKPKVSTWGLFPRPDNISRKYGGGKNIPVGGVDLNNEESKQRKEAVARKLAAYRASRGIDIEREEKHRDEIESALDKATEQLSRSLPYEAIRTLQTVQNYVSDQSRLGGRLFLQLALAYDSVGRRDEARNLYVQLRRNPFPEISGKAKQLLQGFAAMDMLRVEDEAKEQGFRVTDFKLPDVAAGIDKRYETAVVSGDAKRSEPIDGRTSWLLVLLIFGPLVFVLLVLPALR